ncbi:MAG: ABC transporter substrate-binding protein [Oscillospiraceae bacterium]|nr:ABC transporter substrate-binding protein [Oscillospiraceae bacterium]
MKKSKKNSASILLCAFISALILPACSRFTEIADVSEPTPPPPAATPEPEPDNTGTNRDHLAVGYSEFGEKFSPFYAKLEADSDIVALTSAKLHTINEQGNTVYDAAVNRLYPGIANLEVSYDEQNNKTSYAWRIRDDILFSDGEQMTADDIIFSYYVLCDYSYTGPVKVAELPIEGLSNYKHQTTDKVYTRYRDLFYEIYALGKQYEKTDEDNWTPEQQAAVWACVDTAWENDALAIVEYCVDNYLNSRAEASGRTPREIIENKGLQIAFGMWIWGYGEFTPGGGLIGKHTGKSWELEDSDHPSASDFVSEFKVAYGDNPEKYREIESASGVDLIAAAADIFVRALGSKDPENDAGGVPNISGIKKTGDHGVTVTLSGDIKDAAGLLGIYVSPLHHYGDKALYDYENNRFGFEFGDLSGIKGKNAEPLGAGPYTLTEYEDGTAILKQNEGFYGKEPKIGEIRLLTVSKTGRVHALEQGEIDIGRVSPLKDTESIEAANINSAPGEETLRLFAFPGSNYGYIGINSASVKVGDEADSEESRNLRKAFAVIFAAYRETAVTGATGAAGSVFGEIASVCKTPIAMPGGTLNYDKDVKGNDIYDLGMTDDARLAQASAAAVGYLSAAGYVRDENTGKFVEAPEGALTEYNILLPETDGEYKALSDLAALCAAALEEFGITLKIQEGAASGPVHMRGGIYNSVTGNDMFHIYRQPGGFGNMTSPELGEILESMKNMTDTAELIGASERCAEIISDWAVMIPVFRDSDGIVINTETVNITGLSAAAVSADRGRIAFAGELELNRKQPPAK